jgi:BirA family biotin operon repressor/biotin-[acetyl-CoA-carboxylase] ligase
MGRSWASPPGNLHASFAVPRGAGEEWRRPWLAGVAAALAAADAATRFVEDGAETRIKWPNDVLLGGAKSAGVLVESAGAFIVAGIGMNVAWAPEGAPYPATCLDAHRARPAVLAEVEDALDEAFAGWLARWLGEGFAPLREALLSRSHQPGERLSVQDGAGRAEGAFAGIDEDGFLLLDTAAGRRRFSAGDVFPNLAPRQD